MFEFQPLALTWACASSAFGSALLALLLVNALVCLAVHLLHLRVVFGRDAPRPPAVPPQSDLPFVSVHVPTHDEPASLVIATLEALRRLDYPAFEVLVLDNNTPDPRTYRPVAAACRRLGPNFRFFHFDGVQGAKAGALNLGLARVDPATRLVAVVDADYAVDPSFLRVAAPHLAAGGAAFVQFPQAYRGIGPAGGAVALELADYFDAFAPKANATRSMLLTGTLSVIDLEAIRQIGGWNGLTITEDAELGLRLVAEGREGVFVDRIMGRGLLPLSLQGLKAQRHRWVAGNVQTLLGAFRHGGLRSRQGALSCVAQLTAWPAFWLLPALALGLTTPLPKTPLFGLAADVASATILFSALLISVRLYVGASRRGEPLSSILPALAVKLALVWTSSLAWLPALTRRPLPFVRTDKVSSDTSRSLAGANGFACLLGGVVGAMALGENHPVTAMACLLIAGTCPAALWVRGQLLAYARTVAAR